MIGCILANPQSAICQALGDPECVPKTAEEGSMATDQKAPETIDEYIATFPPEIQEILEKVRRTIREARQAQKKQSSIKSDLHAERQLGAFRYVQEAYRVLSYAHRD